MLDVRHRQLQISWLYRSADAEGFCAHGDGSWSDFVEGEHEGALHQVSSHGVQEMTMGMACLEIPRAWDLLSLFVPLDAVFADHRWLLRMKEIVSWPPGSAQPELMLGEHGEDAAWQLLPIFGFDARLVKLVLTPSETSLVALAKTVVAAILSVDMKGCCDPSSVALGTRKALASECSCPLVSAMSSQGGIWVFLEILVAALDYYMGRAPDAQPPGNVLVADSTILINFAGVMAIARTMEATQNVLSESGVSCAGDLAKLSQDDVQAFLGDFCQCFIDQLTLVQYEGEGHRARDLTNRRRVISALKNSLFWPDLEKTIENIGTNGTAYGIVNCYDVVTESPVTQAIPWTFVPSTIVEWWYWMDLEISQGYGHPTLQGPEVPFAMPN